MALHFVSTSVLTSGDGIAFENEEKKDSEEVRNAARYATIAASRPLFEQLAEQKEKKQLDHDAVTKLIFAPTKALDEEEADYYNELADQHKKLMELRHTTEEQEIKQFRSSTSTSEKREQTSAMTSVMFSKPEKSVQKTVIPTVVVKSKRKQCVSNNEEKTTKKRERERETERERKNEDYKDKIKKPADERVKSHESLSEANTTSFYQSTSSINSSPIPFHTVNTTSSIGTSTTTSTSTSTSTTGYTKINTDINIKSSLKEDKNKIRNGQNNSLGNILGDYSSDSD